MMKKITLILFTILFHITIYAQGLNFLGVPLGSKRQDFESVLKDRGCKSFGSEGYWGTNGIASKTWKGDFWKLNDCKITLHAYKSYDCVTSVSVYKFFDAYSDVRTLEDYIKVVFDLYTDFVQKFGKETSVENPYDHIEKITWKLAGGEIQLHYDRKVVGHIYLNYVSNRELILRNEETRFKGQGENDL